MNRLAIVAVTAAPVLLAVATACVAPEKTTAGSSPATGWSSATTSSKPVVAPPAPADFLVSVIVTEQKCFGSAGCSYSYTINPQYISSKPLPEKTTVVFTVTGGEQDQVGNFTIDSGGTATFDRETRISGEENANLQATVTQVIPGR